MNLTYAGWMATGDPDAIYDLPAEKRERAIAMVMAMEDSDGFAIDSPVTMKNLHRWALTKGLLPRGGPGG